MKQASSAEVRSQFSDHISRAQLTGERIVVTRKGRPVAAIISIGDLKLLQAVEDHIDRADADDAVREAVSEGWLTWEEVDNDEGL